MFTANFFLEKMRELAKSQQNGEILSSVPCNVVDRVFVVVVVVVVDEILFVVACLSCCCSFVGRQKNVRFGRFVFEFLFSRSPFVVEFCSFVSQLLLLHFFSYSFSFASLFRYLLCAVYLYLPSGGFKRFTSRVTASQFRKGSKCG